VEVFPSYTYLYIFLVWIIDSISISQIMYPPSVKIHAYIHFFKYSLST